MAVSEAMLAGVPMIVSDISPLREATQEGALAEIFPAGNEDVLSEKLLAFLGNPVVRDYYSGRAKAYANDNFNIDAHLRELQKLYRSLE